MWPDAWLICAASSTCPRDGRPHPDRRALGLHALPYAASATVPTTVFLVQSNTCLVDSIYPYFDFINVNLLYFLVPGASAASSFGCSMYLESINTWWVCHPLPFGYQLFMHSWLILLPIYLLWISVHVLQLGPRLVVGIFEKISLFSDVPCFGFYVYCLQPHCSGPI